MLFDQVIAVVKPSVSGQDIARFVYLAHGAKMDRTSNGSRNLRFLGPNRDLYEKAHLYGAAQALAAFVGAFLIKKKGIALVIALVIIVVGVLIYLNL